MSSAYPASSQMEPIGPHLETTPLFIRKIMVAADFSSQSQMAVKYAARLAQRMKSQIEILHVVPTQLYVTDAYVLPAELDEAERARGGDALAEFTKKIPELHGLRHKDIVLSGPAAESIIEAARNHAVDLLVMGSQGRSGIKKLVLGSVAEKVVRNLHCPVLVIGPHCAPQDEDLKSVLLAVDVPMRSLRAAQYAVAIARQAGATLTIAHIYPAVQPLDIDQSTINDTVRELRSLVPSQGDIVNSVQFRTAKGGVAEEILKVASERKPGIIVTSPKEHVPVADHVFGAVLSDLISKSPYPILAVSRRY